MVKKVYEWKPMSRIALGRPKTRWENYVRNDLNTMGIHNWRDCMQDRCKWKGVVKKVKKIQLMKL
jgi:hypothetical protein